jgi:hypothetical protein
MMTLKPLSIHHSSFRIHHFPYLFDLQPAWSQVQTEVGSESFESSQ